MKRALRLSVALAASAAAESGGDWMLVFPAGATATRKGDDRGPFRLPDVAAMEKAIAAARQRLRGIEMRVVYDHAHEGPAAGWVKKLEARADGIWAQVEWTEKARAAIKAGEYRYLSPTFFTGKDNVVTELVDVALVNYPAFDLEAVAASAENPKSEATMEFMTKLRAALKLGEDASEDAILAAVSGKGTKTEPQAMSAVALAAGLAATASADELVAAVTAMKGAATGEGTVNAADFAALKADAVKLAAELNTLKADQAREKATALVDGAIKAGCVGFNALNRERKIALAAASPEGFAAVTADIADAPKIAGGAIVPSGKPDKDGTVALSATDREIAAMMGLDLKKFAAQRAAEQEAAL